MTIKTIGHDYKTIVMTIVLIVMTIVMTIVLISTS